MNVQTWIDAHAGRPEELIQVLHHVQGKLGYISPETQERIATALGVPISRVYGVVTFYHFFRTRPVGRHTIRLCLGTACHVRGAAQILSTLQNELGVSVGETTADRLFTLEVVRCLGTCSLAPVMMIDDAYYGRLEPETTLELVRSVRESRESAT
jgi:NADH:ubiquinone oxidoreductase subunit E